MALSTSSFGAGSLDSDQDFWVDLHLTLRSSHSLAYAQTGISR
jgi:hypothetical protein